MKYKMKWLSLGICVLFISTVFSAPAIKDGAENFEISSTDENSSAVSVPQNDKPRAYVMVGNTEGVSPGKVRLVAEEAMSDYQDAGYEVILIPEATADDVEKANNDEKTEAIWIYGHGVGEKKNLIVDFSEGIAMNGGTYIQGKDWELGGATGENIKTLKKNEKIKQVTFHACGQNQQSWRDLFPNAKFRSWSGKVRHHSIFWWQYFSWYSSVTSNVSLIPPNINSIFQKGCIIPFDDMPEFCYWDISLNGSDFPLPEPLASQFGVQSINFYIVETDDIFGDIPEPPETLPLYGADVVNGAVTQWHWNVTSTPTIDVIIINQAYYDILEEPSTVWDAYETGNLQIIPYTPSNMSTLLDGIAGLFFGQTSSINLNIIYPLDRYVYVFGLPFMPFPSDYMPDMHFILAVGPISFRAIAESPNGIEKVGFYIDNGVIHWDTRPPYTYFYMPSFGPGWHTLHVVAYDGTGLTATQSMQISSIGFFVFMDDYRYYYATE